MFSCPFISQKTLCLCLGSMFTPTRWLVLRLELLLAGRTGGLVSIQKIAIGTKPVGGLHFDVLIFLAEEAVYDSFDHRGKFIVRRIDSRYCIRLHKYACYLARTNSLACTRNHMQHPIRPLNHKSNRKYHKTNLSRGIISKT